MFSIWLGYCYLIEGVYCRWEGTSVLKVTRWVGKINLTFVTYFYTTSYFLSLKWAIISPFNMAYLWLLFHHYMLTGFHFKWKQRKGRQVEYNCFMCQILLWFLSKFYCRPNRTYVFITHSLLCFYVISNVLNYNSDLCRSIHVKLVMKFCLKWQCFTRWCSKWESHFLLCVPGYFVNVLEHLTMCANSH